MSKYIYTAKIKPHKSISGEIAAESLQDALNKLNKMGYFPVSVQPQEVFFASQNILNLRRVPRSDVVLFTRQLSSLLESGLNILDALIITSRQATSKYLSSIIEGLIGRVKDGKPLSESLGAYPHLFSGLYISMVRSGEAGGNAEQALKRLADFLEKEDEFRGSLRQALAYPVFILGVSILTVIVLLGFVIPRLAGMFEDMGQALPLPTQILISVSGLLRAYWWLIVAVAAATVFTLQKIMKSPQAKSYYDKLKLRLWLLGEVVLKTQISRLTRTLSLLLTSGIPVVEALDISSRVLTNELLREQVQKFRSDISKGSSLSRCLSGSKLFPPFVVNIVAVGEQTGSVERSLLRIADDYERDVDRMVKTYTRLLEPLIILVMGLIVGFIVLSMLLPIFQINLIAR